MDDGFILDVPKNPDLVGFLGCFCGLLSRNLGVTLVVKSAELIKD